mgnify:CR=1 FL=1
MKKAVIFGISGQDGSYLAELLLEKGYQVFGVRRRHSTSQDDKLLKTLHQEMGGNDKFKLFYGDLTDTGSVNKIIAETKPDEIYNLAAQSHVNVSFDLPEYTADVNALGTLRILEAIRNLKLENDTKFYQASTSELYGKVREIPQNERTPFYPRSPYAVAKLFSYWATVNYREAFGIYACNGILFNHESPRRDVTFVTRKITNGLSKIVLGLEECLYLGNLDALRDWGHARDYVEMQWLMMQQKNADDYVIASGRQTSVRDFIKIAATHLGFSIEFKGTGVSECGIVSSIENNQLSGIQVGDEIIKSDPKYYRPSEVETLLGDAKKAAEKLGWTPKVSLEGLIQEMIDHDYLKALEITQNKAVHRKSLEK